ncbi:hypothetical protein CR513_45575, partial [Mucuna pruriens]
MPKGMIVNLAMKITCLFRIQRSLLLHKSNLMMPEPIKVLLAPILDVEVGDASKRRQSARHY